jgi:hypothetical protein
MTTPSPSPTAATGSLARTPTAWILGAIMVAALALRLVYSVAAHVVTFDSSTVGLMALNILEGDWPLFYYGQNYMGALEAYVAAGMVFLFGVSDLSISLSPILFSIVWVGACFLLYRELAGPVAGLVAAAVAAFSGYFVIWWNVDNNGGYAPVLALGTIALWLCARIANRPTQASPPWGQTAALGVVSALGIWSNLSIAPFLMVGAILLSAHLVAARFPPRLLVCFGCGALLAVTGFLPSLWNPQDCVLYPLSKQFVFTAGHWQKSWQMLLSQNLPALVFWDMTPAAAEGIPGSLTPVVYPLMAGTLVVIALLYGLRCFQAGRSFRSLQLAVPALFLLIFALLYFPHWMSVLRAPRYFMNGWAMLSIGIFAIGATDAQDRFRRWVWPLLVFWIVSQLAANALFMQKMQPFKTEKMAKELKAVDTVRELGVRSVQMVGDSVFGYRGHILSYFSENRIRFVSNYDERYQPSAQALDSDPRPAIAVRNHHSGKLAAGLRAAGVAHRLADTGWLSIAHDLRPKWTARRLVPADAIRVTVSAAAPPADAANLIDRNSDTTVLFPPPVDGRPKPSVVIDLGRSKPVDSLWIWAPDIHQFGVPEGYRISASSDGATYTTWREVDNQIGATYASGPAAYAQGYFGIQECRLDGRPARFIKLVLTRPNRAVNQFVLAEIYVFEANPAQPPVPDAAASARTVMSAATSRAIDFTVADRWVSAQIIADRPPARIAGPYPALPRCNPYKFAFSMKGRTVVPRPGLALAPAVEVADECRQLLIEAYGAAAVREAVDCGRYRLIVCGPPRSAHPRPSWSLFWNGHTLVKTTDPQAIWPKRNR